MPLPSELAEKYFTEPVNEYFAPASGLRWYSPCRIGESDLYDFLGRFPGYYNPASWDKVRCLELLLSLPFTSVVDVGCGNAWVIEHAAQHGKVTFGTEINPDAIRNANQRGLAVFSPDDSALTSMQADVLVSLQTLEHVTNPAEWLANEFARFGCRAAIIAVPAHDTMLGRSRDPLAWPPHHFTQWSGRALGVLAKRLGLALEAVHYEPNSWLRFENALEREPNRRFWKTLPFPRRGSYKAYHLLERLGVPWVCRAHTVLGVMTQAK